MAKRIKPPRSPKFIHPIKAPEALKSSRQEKLNHVHTLREGLIILIVLVLAAIPFGMGRYIEFNSPDPFDSGAYVYSAHHILQGAQIGIEEKLSAQIGTLLVNMLGVRIWGYSEFGPKLLQTILQSAALILMFFALRRLLGLLPAAVALLIPAVYLSSPILAKFGNVKEQYMIAFMVLGISCFIFRQLQGRWWWAVLAGIFLVWAPLFKPTGVSAQAAVGLFILAQPLFKHRGFKQTGQDLLLLLAGAAISLAPIFIWMEAVDARMSRPYGFVWKTLAPGGEKSTPPQASKKVGRTAQSDTPPGENTDISAPAPPKAGPKSYVSRSRELHSFARQFPTVMRFYQVLMLPILLAFGALIARLVKMFPFRRKSSPAERRKDYDRFVLLLAVWWLLDMAFVWISPRSYEQYYLPISPSAAMLGAYLMACYRDKLAAAPNRSAWAVVGLVGIICMIFMSWHIFFGLQKSAHHGGVYLDSAGKPQRRYGLIQNFREAADRKQRGIKGTWQAVAEYIRNNTLPTDKIYVWGWYPGIYVQAQRLSSSPYAFESEMHTTPPEVLALRINEIVSALQAQPPQFIVDSQKMHFPFYEHPVFDLWPRWRDRKKIIFDLKLWGDVTGNKLSYLTLEEEEKYHTQLNRAIELFCLSRLTDPQRQGGPLTEDKARARNLEEIARHEAIRPLQKFVMEYYQPLVPADSAMFIFERKKD